MISLTVERRYGTATVRARVAASSPERALGLCKDARIVSTGEEARSSPAALGRAKGLLPGKPFTRRTA